VASPPAKVDDRLGIGVRQVADDIDEGGVVALPAREVQTHGGVGLLGGDRQAVDDVEGVGALAAGEGEVQAGPGADDARAQQGRVVARSARHPKVEVRIGAQRADRRGGDAGARQAFDDVGLEQVVARTQVGDDRAGHGDVDRQDGVGGVGTQFADVYGGGPQDVVNDLVVSACGIHRDFIDVEKSALEGAVGKDHDPRAVVVN